MATLNYQWYLYTNDDGDEFNAKISTQYGGFAGCDFSPYDITKPVLPKGWKMRFVYFMDTATGNIRRIPCGTKTADIWTGVTATITLLTLGSGTGTVFSRGRPINEWVSVPRTIHNL